MESKKNIQRNPYTKQKQTHRHRKQFSVTKGERGGEEQIRSMRLTDTNNYTDKR